MRWINPETKRPESGQKIIFEDAVGMYKGTFDVVKSGVVYVEGKHSDVVEWNDVYNWIEYPEDSDATITVVMPSDDNEMEKSRHFFVSIVSKNFNGSLSFDNLHIEALNGEHPTVKRCMDVFKENNKGQRDGLILSISEMSEQDYNTFISEK